MRAYIALVIALGAIGAPGHVPSARVGGPAHAEPWTIAEDAPCTGLTIGWAVPVDELRRVVGPGLEPAAGPAPGTGLMLLFAAKCPGSAIGGHRTGPFVTTHVIVPIAPPHLPDSERTTRDAKGWIAIPESFGASKSPVAALFRRHGFVVQQGTATVEVEPGAQGTRGHLVLTTPHGRLDATATFADSARRFESMTGLVGGSDAARAFAHGPEHSMRTSGGHATVSTRGTTILSGLHPVGQPVAVLDTSFAWSFSFEGARTSGRK